MCTGRHRARCRARRRPRGPTHPPRPLQVVAPASTACLSHARRTTAPKHRTVGGAAAAVQVHGSPPPFQVSAVADAPKGGWRETAALHRQGRIFDASPQGTPVRCTTTAPRLLVNRLALALAATCSRPPDTSVSDGQGIWRRGTWHACQAAAKRPGEGARSVGWWRARHVPPERGPPSCRSSVRRVRDTLQSLPRLVGLSRPYRRVCRNTCCRSSWPVA